MYLWACSFYIFVYGPMKNLVFYSDYNAPTLSCEIYKRGLWRAWGMTL